MRPSAAGSGTCDDAHDARALDTIDVDGDVVYLEVGEFVASLEVPGGPGAAAVIHQGLLPHTRDAAIVDPMVYRDAVTYRTALEAARDHEVVFVGADAVLLRGPYVQIGQVAFRRSEVQEYAEAGANVPLGGGRLLQAALAILAAKIAERDRKEELRVLAARIGEYRPPVI